MENIRLFLVATLCFLGLMLWQAWDTDYGKPPAAVPPAADIETPQVPEIADDTPALPLADDAASVISDAPPATSNKPATSNPERLSDSDEALTIDVRTDVLSLSISSLGGTITRSALNAYPIHQANPDQPVELFGNHPPKVYLHQGGLAGKGELPTHHENYSVAALEYELRDGDTGLTVPLTWRNDAGVQVEKRFHLERDSYVVQIEYVINNQSSETITVHQYDQLKRNEESSRQGMVYTFTGAALSTPEKPFEKFDLGDLEDQPIKITTTSGWISIIQHYFVAALIPPAEQQTSFYSKVLDGNKYLVGFLSPAADVPAGQSHTFTSNIYIGPKRYDRLGKIAPALEKSIDYGVLWFIAEPLFKVLRYIHDVTGNWGWAIIIVTILLKLLFFPLSAAGYRSMANMRKVQPRMLALRDRYKDDRAQLNQAMMTLYKEEKINPLGGCLPIVIQIPVFIALYWVLLESVEMRQAPFILWLKDLSTRDPFFVLPLLMGITMWLQQKLNPAPLDPIQAKVMQILPFVFTVFFAFFPSGLVLYWLVNNMLSIAQQWHITRSIDNQA